MAVVGLGVHPSRPEAAAEAERATSWLGARGHQVRRISTDGLACDAAELDLAVSLGGDGTMLRVVDAVRGADVPVLGVNFGHLGYLTVVERSGLEAALERFFSGDYAVESRMTLDVAVEGDGAHPVRRALNDVVLQRVQAGHTVRAELHLHHEPFLTYTADSLIVATPTGSTAYNLSARGPIVSPDARVIVVTPVAAHSLFDRSLVLGPHEQVELVPDPEGAAELVVDGWEPIAVGAGDRIVCRAGGRDALLVTFGERDFHRILKGKFSLDGAG